MSPYVVTFNIQAALAALTVDNTACASLNTPQVPVKLGTGAVVLVPLPCTPAATTAVVGTTALATTAEAIAGTVTTKAVTPAALQGALAKQAEVIGPLNISGDETTVLTAVAGKYSFRMPFPFALSSVRASLAIAASSGIVTINIKESGVTIFSTKLTIDATEKTSTTAAIFAVISDASLADDAEITVDIDVAGTGAAGLKIHLIGTRI